MSTSHTCENGSHKIATVAREMGRGSYRLTTVSVREHWKKLTYILFDVLWRNKQQLMFSSLKIAHCFVVHYVVPSLVLHMRDLAPRCGTWKQGCRDGALPFGTCIADRLAVAGGFIFVTIATVEIVVVFDVAVLHKLDVVDLHADEVVLATHQNELRSQRRMHFTV